MHQLDGNRFPAEWMTSVPVPCSQPCMRIFVVVGAFLFAFDAVWVGLIEHRRRHCIKYRIGESIGIEIILPVRIATSGAPIPASAASYAASMTSMPPFTTCNLITCSTEVEAESFDGGSVCMSQSIAETSGADSDNALQQLPHMDVQHPACKAETMQ